MLIKDFNNLSVIELQEIYEKTGIEFQIEDGRITSPEQKELYK